MPPRRRPRTQTDSEPCCAPSCNRLVTNHSGGVQCSERPTWFQKKCGGFSCAVHFPEHWQCPLIIIIKPLWICQWGFLPRCYNLGSRIVTTVYTKTKENFAVAVALALRGL